MSSIKDVLLHLGIQQIHLDGVALVNVHVSEKQSLPVRLEERGKVYSYLGNMVCWVLKALDKPSTLWCVCVCVCVRVCVCVSLEHQDLSLIHSLLPQ